MFGKMHASRRLMVSMAVAAVTISSLVVAAIVAANPNLWICGGGGGSASSRPLLPPRHASHAHQGDGIHGAEEPVCFQHRRVVLMGDSTMSRTAYAFAHLFNCTVVREGSRCGFESYYGHPVRQEAYATPVPAGAGPVLHGRTARGCMDCVGCHPRQWYCAVPDLTVEFLGVEFARDVEYPTALGDYTQESIVKGYLAHNISSSTYALVFNTALHDLAIPPPTNETSSALSSYASNLNWMTSMLVDALGSTQPRTRLMWISTARVASRNQPESWRAITSNERIAEFNSVAAGVMRRWRIPTLDVYPMSKIPGFEALALDGVHYGSPSQFYYRYVALKIALELCSAPRLDDDESMTTPLAKRK